MSGKVKRVESVSELNLLQLSTIKQQLDQVTDFVMFSLFFKKISLLYSLLGD